MNPTQAAPVAPTEITARCTCGLAISHPMPHHRVWNEPATSVIVIPHEHGVTCSGCGRYWAAAIAQYQLTFVLMEAEVPVEASRIIQPLTIPTLKGHGSH